VSTKKIHAEAVPDKSAPGSRDRQFSPWLLYTAFADSFTMLPRWPLPTAIRPQNEESKVPSELLVSLSQSHGLMKYKNHKPNARRAGGES